MKQMPYPFQYAVTNIVTKKLVWVSESDYELWLKDKRKLLETVKYIRNAVESPDANWLDPDEYVIHRLIDTHIEPYRCVKCGTELSARNSTGYCPKHRHLSESVRIQRRENQRIRVGTKKYYKKSEGV